MADAVTLFRVLSDGNRIKIAAAIMDRALSVDEIATAVQLPPKTVWGHIGTFQMVDLVEERLSGNVRTFRFNQRPLHEALKSLAPKREENLDHDLDAFDRKVLGDFLVDGRLKSIPAQHKKRDVVLRFLAERFEPQRMYGEKEVNAILREYHDDVASLRRYLVDEGMVTRQIIREVESEALMAGNAKVEHRILYWKPDESHEV